MELCSVIYFRVGYSSSDFPSEAQWEAKMLLEKSSSLKSPSVAMHLAGSKKIQQALAEEGVLRKVYAKRCDRDAKSICRFVLFRRREKHAKNNPTRII